MAQVRQPERFNSRALPNVETVNEWEDAMAQEFRLITGGGEHAERYFRKAFEAARKMKEPEGSPAWMEAFEALQCDHGPYAIPEEKAVASLADRLPAGMARRWALLKQKRRSEGLAAPLGRQIVFFILSGFKLDESTGAPAALISLLSLRDASRKDPLSISTLAPFIDTWNKICLLYTSPSPRD